MTVNAVVGKWVSLCRRITLGRVGALDVAIIEN
jgi:hypothetical protein